METVNGFTIIARSYDRNGLMVIFGVRKRPDGEIATEFEYVTAIMGHIGDDHWCHGHYSNHWQHAFSDFQERVSA